MLKGWKKIVTDETEQKKAELQFYNQTELNVKIIQTDKDGGYS